MSDQGPETIAAGTSGMIQLRPDRNLIEKVPWPDPYVNKSNIRDLKREYAVYQRIGPHPRLLHLKHESTPERLVFLYLENGCLHDWLRRSFVSTNQRLQFAADAAEGLYVLHHANVIHSDLSTWNFLVTTEQRLCIIDFAGSTMDGQIGSGLESVRNYLPRPIKDAPDIRSDLFALGSVMYEIALSGVPFSECEESEVEDRYRRHEFPTTQNLVLGNIMLGCWQGTYHSAKQVLDDIEEHLAEFQDS